jgi:hypothetical protein
MPIRIFALLLATIAPLASALGPVYSLHLNANTDPVKLHPIYINDAEVHAKIPAFARIGAQFDTCYQGMTHPNLLDVTYSPTVVAPHRGDTNVLNCTVAEGADMANCEIAPPMNVVFGDDPKRYFSLGTDTPLHDAIEVADAFNRHTLQFAQGVELEMHGIRIREIARRGSTFEIERADCGCGDTITVELRHAAGKPVATVIAYSRGVCI